MGARILKDLSNEQALKDRIAELEAQLASGQKNTKVTVTMKHDKPFLSFEGSFVPFSLSQPKAKRLMEHMDLIKRFSETGKLD